ncbi:MAG: efflux RND transporter periplasmic adaptor subunit [Chromatiales bacterium]
MRRFLLTLSLLALTAATGIAVLYRYTPSATSAGAGSIDTLKMSVAALAAQAGLRVPWQETAVEHAKKHLDPTYFCPMHPQVVRDEPGRCPICGMDLVPLASAAGAQTPAAAAMPASGERQILYYRNPMGQPDTSPVPKKDPMGMDYVPVYEDEMNGGAAPAGPPIVTVRPEVVNNLGVRTAQVERGALAREIETVGYVGYDESKIGHVHVRTEGWIERLTVNSVGAPVKPGDLLFEVYSPTLVTAQEEYLQAVASGNERLIAASRSRLAALGISESGIKQLERTRKADRTVKVFAHHGGVVSDLMVREGMYLEPATEIMTIINLDSVWLVAEVFERQADWVRVGQRATARIPSLPDKVWDGEVEYIYPDLDPTTRTLRVRLRFDNPEGRLKPNMYAHVTVFAEPRANALSIPQEALIRDANGERVVLALGEGRFQQREVTPGIESGDRIEITKGLSESDEVVVSAQFLIDSEANLTASFQRMEPQQRPGTSGPAAAGVSPGTRTDTAAHAEGAK